MRKILVFSILTAVIPFLAFAQVNEEWVARYNGPGNGRDFPGQMIIDSSGNVYVSGSSLGSNTAFDIATIKYDRSGQRQWIVRYEDSLDQKGGTLAVDLAGNIYVSGYDSTLDSGLNILTIKYNTLGQQQWVSSYDSPGGMDDRGGIITLDPSGHVYVAGSCSNCNDYLVVKYDSSGQQEWFRSYNGPEGSVDFVRAMCVDSKGNVYVTGQSEGENFSQADYATVKYDSSGQEQWVARYDGPGSKEDYAYAVAVDTSGNVYVTGSCDMADYEFDFATIKYDSNGKEQWVAFYNGPGNYGESAYDIVTDLSGDIFVTGRSYGAGTGEDYVTIKYSTSGQEQWVARYNGPGNGWDEARSIALDREGNVYVTGKAFIKPDDWDYVTIKYDSSGQEKWVKRYSGPGGKWDYAYVVKVDASGYVYVSGGSWGADSDWDYAIIKYSQGPGIGEQRQEQSPSALEVTGSRVRFSIPQSSHVTLDLYNAAGSRVERIASGHYPAGAHSVSLKSQSFPSGVYFVKLDTDNFISTAKLVIIE